MEALFVIWGQLMRAGAQRVFGVEFAENIGYKMVLEAVVRRMKKEYGIELNLDWIGSAI